MSEEQIVEFTILKEDMSNHDTGGGVRLTKAEITIDSSLPAIRQREVLIHEMLGTYLGLVISTEDISEIASRLNEGICQLEE